MIRQKIRNWLFQDIEKSSHLSGGLYSWSNFYRPYRKAYLQEKRSLKSGECVFCEGAKKLEVSKNLCLYKSSTVLVFLNKYPYNTGHVLVLPRKHTEKLQSLSISDRSDFFKSLVQVSQILEEVYECEALNMGLNQGRFAGAGLPQHLHFHVIPRWAGDSNFFPLTGGEKVFSESVEQSYARLKPHFETLCEDKKNDNASVRKSF